MDFSVSSFQRMIFLFQMQKEWEQLSDGQESQIQE